MELCRLCHSKTPTDTNRNIFSYRNTNDLQIFEIILKLTGLKILENDPYPNVICNNCYEKLINFNDFRQLILHVDTIFHQESNHIIDNNLIKIEEDIVDNINNQQSDIDSYAINTEEIIKNDPEATNSDPIADDCAITITNNQQSPSANKYECEICGKFFTQKGTLNIHKRLHTGIKPYQCNICKKTFSQKSHLKIHLKVHSGERSHQCDLCDKKFVQKQHLDKHLNVHTGEKLYKCDICQKNYAGKQYLNKHLQIHSGQKPFKCKICEKTFALHPYLITHLKVHSGEKPFICRICERSFSQKINLTTHLRVHNGEKPFICHICKRHFSQNRDLKVHLKIRHHMETSDGEMLE